MLNVKVIIWKKYGWH